LASLSFQYWQIQGVCITQFSSLNATSEMARRYRHFSLCFYSWWLKWSWIWTKVITLFFSFFFLVHSSFCRLLSHHLIFLFAASYFGCFCLCSKSDELRVNYCHIVGHLLRAMFHIASDFLLIALDDLLILPLLSFFFMLWIFSSNC
jgi:hypothetical protein